MFDFENLTSGDLLVNGLKIHYYRTGGDKPALVLLHGITDSAQCWPRVVRHLGAEFDMVMLDARGHGRSDAPESGFSFQEQAADVVGVVESLKLNRPVLVGHSMGAMTALLVAASCSGLVRALILEDPPLSPQEHITADEAKIWLEDARIRIEKEQIQSLIELVAKRRNQSPNWSDDELIPWAEAKHQVSPRIAEIAFSLQLPWRSLFTQIDCPILLLTSDPSAGARVTPEIADEAASYCSDGRVVYIRDAGHNIRRDQFEKYLAAVNGFLVDVHQIK